MARTHRPEFFELSRSEANELLTRHRVGRLAFTFHDRVDIEPISYVFAEGWLYGRTSHGTKLTTVKHHPWVAFEVDEVEGPFDWRSVVVHGTVYMLQGAGTDAERRAYRSAVRLLRRLVPGTLGKRDPVPFRSVVMKLHVDRVSGRLARSGRKRS